MQNTKVIFITLLVGIFALLAMGTLLLTQNKGETSFQLFKKHDLRKNHEKYWDYDGCKPAVKGQYALACDAMGGALCGSNSHGYHECCEGAKGKDPSEYCSSYLFGKYKQCKKSKYPYINHEKLPCPTDPCKEPCPEKICKGGHHSGFFCWSGPDDTNPFVCDEPHWHQEGESVCYQSCTAKTNQKRKCQYNNWNQEVNRICFAG